MSLGQKLIRRIGAQARKVKRLAPDFEKINEQTSVLSRAVGSQKLILSSQRQTDQSGIGLAVLAQKIEVAKLVAQAAALSEHLGHLQAVMSNPANPEADLSIEAEDLAEVLSGELIGNFYTIQSVVGSTITFVESAPAGYAGETGISLRFEMRTTKPQILPNATEL